MNGNATYRRLFSAAFARSGTRARHRATGVPALAAAPTSLVSLNSRYDRYVHGYDAALTEREIQGLNVFRSFVARCSSATRRRCSNEQVAVIGAPGRKAVRSTSAPKRPSIRRS
jgi:cytochrome c peroxidase